MYSGRKPISFHGKHIIISALGSRGDIHPFIGITSELRNRGARITFAVSDYYRELIEKHEFSIVPTGSKEAYIEFHNDARIWKSGTNIVEKGWTRTVRPAMEKSCAVVEEAVEAGGDVIVLGIQPMFNGAYLAAEALNLPVINFTLAPQYIQSDISPPAPLKWVLPKWLPQKTKSKIIQLIRNVTIAVDRRKDYFWEYNGMRRVRGLKPIRDYSMKTVCSNKYLQISLYPPWFGMPVSDWPAHIHMTGFPLFDEKKQKCTKR